MSSANILRVRASKHSPNFASNSSKGKKNGTIRYHWHAKCLGGVMQPVKSFGGRNLACETEDFKQMPSRSYAFGEWVRKIRSDIKNCIDRFHCHAIKK